ncbi:hypothetical protein JX265_008253 [Neoarthrinium moseri]|uniref:Uncharacterized protein n=1 Tax=Neoarthrinium moseri TaxID=1658444 RepID=A0A9Q0ANS5_9PEZI|nr:uncharacterized protein JN550_004952 [Neoarthrinium moseri]KAI1851942.1 hypothetical protein JX266_002795 [Neoarthrinium moseri]KAI1865206.1 hypothetical protein JX265_008253 [Neoarthrinium moseri]KAI1870806.1 hypothetical protein JN550_004952 [Neoarthrinium moseri]
MSTTVSSNPLRNDAAFNSDSDSDGQARGGRRALAQVNQQNQQVLPLPQLPTSSGLSQPAGQLLRGAVDDEGKQKAAALLVGIKLDLEAEVHLTARVRGDICIGLY